MKELIMVRHGKSSWEFGVEDRDRPLQERGIQDAHKVSRHLAATSFSPDAVYSSPAIRALHTCVVFLRKLKVPYHKFNLAERLYVFSGDPLTDFILDLPDDEHKVMIFGHNHAFTEIANDLGDRPIDNVPTTGLVHLTFDVNSWHLVRKGKTEKVMFPKALTL
jgi:phosphohistidine phosphatase